MHYSVIFKAVDNKELSGTTCEKVGRAWVEQIREESQCPKLPLELIQGNIYSLQDREASARVSEETAEMTENFLETNEVTVIVPPKGLREFYNLKAVIRQNDTIGAVTGVSVEWVLDKEALVLAWAVAGFPLNWNTEY